MKRFFYTIILMGLMVILMDPAAMLMSKFLHLDEPTTHEIQEGEWLSLVAQKYYGDATYWKELALINRAPNGDLIFPGEKIVVPNYEAIQKIRNSRSLSSVNEIVGIQQDILAGRIEHRTEPLADAEQDKEPASEIDDDAGRVSETSEPQIAEVEEEPQPLTNGERQATDGDEETAFFISTPVLTGLVILAVIVAIGIVMFVRGKRREEVTYYGDKSDDEDVEVREKNVYYYDDSDEENKDKRKKKREVEVVEN